MKVGLKLLCLYLAFTVEIRVHASEPVQLPENCLEARTVPCALRLRSADTIRVAQSEISMDEMGLIVREKAEALRLVKGDVFLRTSALQTLRFIYGQFQADPHSELLIERKADVVRLSVLKGQVAILRWQEPKAALIPSGFAIEIGPMYLSGVRISLPEAIDLRDLIATMGRIRPLALSAFREELESWQEAMISARDLTGRGFAKIVTREIASAQRTEIRRKRAMEASEAERKRLHLLFRSRALGVDSNL